jgi:hypothetical protein
LAKLNNSFHAYNRVQCFNHTIQLCAKALLRSLNPGLLGNDDDQPDVNDDDDDDCPPLIIIDESEEEIDETDRDADGAGLSEDDDPNDKIDELEELDERGRRTIIAQTAVVRDAVCWFE